MAYVDHETTETYTPIDFIKAFHVSWFYILYCSFCWDFSTS